MRHETNMDEQKDGMKWMDGVWLDHGTEFGRRDLQK